MQRTQGSEHGDSYGQRLRGAVRARAKRRKSMSTRLPSNSYIFPSCRDACESNVVRCLSQAPQLLTSMRSSVGNPPIANSLLSSSATVASTFATVTCAWRCSLHCRLSCQREPDCTATSSSLILFDRVPMQHPCSTASITGRLYCRTVYPTTLWPIPSSDMS